MKFDYLIIGAGTAGCVIANRLSESNKNNVAIFEAVHGTAPDIAGKGIANPTALFLASAMMLEYINEKNMADNLRNAIRKTLKNKKDRTTDIGGSATTKEYTSLVIANLK